MNKIIKWIGILIYVSLILFIILFLAFMGVFTKDRSIIKVSELNYFHGVVVDETKRPLDSVAITISENRGKWFTNEQGYFRTDTLRINYKEVLFKKNGFKDQPSTSVVSYIRSGINVRIEMFSRKELDTIILYKE